MPTWTWFRCDDVAWMPSMSSAQPHAAASAAERRAPRHQTRCTDADVAFLVIFRPGTRRCMNALLLQRVSAGSQRSHSSAATFSPNCPKIQRCECNRIEEPSSHLAPPADHHHYNALCRSVSAHDLTSPVYLPVPCCSCLCLGAPFQV